jgi:AraC-like DNA-binding protein
MTAPLKNMTSGLTAAKAEAGPTVGAGYAKGVLDFAVSKGASRAELLARAQIAAGDLEDLDNRIPLTRYVALIKAGAALLNEPALALQYGEAVRMQEISIVGLICEACETTLDVGVQLNRYGRLVFDENGEDYSMVRLVRRDDGLWLEVASRTFNSDPLLTEAEFARLVWNTRTMFRSHPYLETHTFPLEIHFTHDEPSYRAEYDRIFQVPITFGSTSNAMRIDPEFLTLRQPPTNRYVFGVLSERAQALLKSLDGAKTARGRVESLLIPELHKGEPSIERVAEQLGTSRQTLYRKLKAEGVNFEKLLDELRHKMALHYLNGKKVSVNETAYLVGFSDPSAFSRAFKRWTGTSPSARAAANGRASEG